MDKREKPKIIEEVGFDFRWDNKKVWALEVAPEQIPISELTWHLEIPFLAVDKPWGWELTAQEVLDNPEKYTYQIERTNNADTSYPIDIMMNKGRWLILDGLHRLMKHVMNGDEKVMVRKIDRTFIPQIQKD